MHPKDADGMANRVDLDQTASSEAVRSWSALFAETYLSQYIEFVRYVIWPFRSKEKLSKTFDLQGSLWFFALKKPKPIML